MPTPYHAILEAGDRLADAVATGDLGRAATVLRERAGLIEAIAGAPPLPDELADRFREQDARLRRVLNGSLRSLADEITEAGRTSTAARAYTTAAPLARLDTGRAPGLRPR